MGRTRGARAAARRRADGSGVDRDRLAYANGPVRNAARRTSPAATPVALQSHRPDSRPTSRPPPEPATVNDAWIADRMTHDRSLGHPQGVRHGQVDERPDQPLDRPARLRRRRPGQGRRRSTPSSAGRNAYTVTQGIPELRGKLQAAVDAEFRHADRQVLVTSGTSGGLLLALCSVVNPGDEVIIFDPYFVMYGNLVDPGRRHAGLRRHLPRLPRRRRQGRRRDHPADQVRARQLARQPDRRRRLGRRDEGAWPSSARSGASC